MDLDRLADALQVDEGFRGRPYEDTTGSITIGYGRNLLSRPLTHPEARYLLKNNLLEVFDDLDRALPWWRSLDAVRQNVLANMAYNLGIGRLLGFVKFLHALKLHDYEIASREMLNSLWAQEVKGRAVRLANEMKTGVS